MKILARVIATPIVFIIGVFMVSAGMLFPIPLIMMFSLGDLIALPFISLLNKGGADISPSDPFISRHDIDIHVSLRLILGVLIPIWAPFAYTWYYIKNGKLYPLD